MRQRRAHTRASDGTRELRTDVTASCSCYQEHEAHHYQHR